MSTQAERFDFGGVTEATTIGRLQNLAWFKAHPGERVYIRPIIEGECPPLRPGEPIPTVAAVLLLELKDGEPAVMATIYRQETDQEEEQALKGPPPFIRTLFSSIHQARMECEQAHQAHQ